MQLNHRYCLAPMLDWTNRHFRYFIRLLSQRTILYTEMVTSGAIIHGDQQYHLRFNEEEHPVALQLGGSHPDDLARCVSVAKQYAYDEINLNVGCPSDRVQQGRFGACLMKEPELVADCVRAMREASDIPVTVKSRIGVDEQEGYDCLHQFVETVAKAGCETFIIHARKAWLKGLSPKENREVPPLKYEYVYRLKQDFPSLEIVINGGVNCLLQVKEHLLQVDGVMIGREAYQNPAFFMCLDEDKTALPGLQQRIEIIERYLPYIERELEKGVKLSALVRPMMCLFNGMKGAKQWRRHLSTHSHAKGAGVSVVREALRIIY